MLIQCPYFRVVAMHSGMPFVVDVEAGRYMVFNADIAGRIE
jgi:hypothetical protein